MSCYASFYPGKKRCVGGGLEVVLVCECVANHAIEDMRLLIPAFVCNQACLSRGRCFQKFLPRAPRSPAALLTQASPCLRIL